MLVGSDAWGVSGPAAVRSQMLGAHLLDVFTVESASEALLASQKAAGPDRGVGISAVGLVGGSGTAAGLGVDSGISTVGLVGDLGTAAGPDGELRISTTGLVRGSGTAVGPNEGFEINTAGFMGGSGITGSPVRGFGCTSGPVAEGGVGEAAAAAQGDKSRLRLFEAAWLEAAQQRQARLMAATGEDQLQLIHARGLFWE